MTDTDTSGASFAQAADTSAPAASAETTAGSFGSTRGSGLARGKRQSSAAAPTSSPVKTDYKPTALEVIVPQREYTNPFASPEAASAPVEEPAEAKAPEAPAAIAAEEAPQPPEAPAAQVAEETVEHRAEIQILPAAESNHPAVSWESPSVSEGAREVSSHDDRPMFRPDRREDRNEAQQPEADRPQFGGREPVRDSFQRQPRDPREARQPRDPRDARQPRDPREARQPRDPRDSFQRQPRDPRDERPQFGEGQQAARTPEPAKPAPGGFLNWLKSLFGAATPVETPAPREQGGESFREGHRPRRRHRGGRGHGGQGGQQQGFRGERSEHGGDRPSPGGERQGQGGERQGGPRRRRGRGGPGRDRGGEFRSEGHKGGGAI
jgi:hypothetical protein